MSGTPPEFPPVDFSTWRAAAERDLKGRDFERALVHHTVGGIRIQPMYVEGGATPGLPGAAPHTRGGSPLEQSQGGWSIVSEPAGPDAPTAASELDEDVAEGATTAWLRLDAAGRSGQDPDQAPGGVGQDGLALHAAADLEVVLARVDLERVAVELEPGGAFAPAAALLAGAWRARGVDPALARGGFGADPLGALARDGELPGSLGGALTSLGDLGAWASHAWPQVAAVRVDTSVYHEAGADDATELGLAVASGLTYLRGLTGAGLTTEHALAQVAFSLPVECDLLLGVAKLRAWRRLWSRVQQELGAEGPFRLHARTSRRMLTQRDPYVNALRTTVAVCAAAQGGAGAISCDPFDAALGLPSPRARRLARNTQLVLRDESQLHRVIDPWGGAYALETLTEELAQQAWSHVQAIEQLGGAPVALTEGWVRERLEAAGEARAASVARRRTPLTGVSEFPNLAEELPTPRQVDREQLVRSAGEAASARRGTDLAPGADLAAAVEAAASGATLGQLRALLPAGEPARLERFSPRRLAAAFEALRDRADAQLAASGARPCVFLASMGSTAEHNARSTWVQNLLAAGGIEVVGGEGYADGEAAAEALRESKATAAVICSTDANYETTVSTLAPALRAAGAARLFLAGKPKQQEDAWRAAGVDGFVHLGIDVVGFLSELHQALEVSA